MRILRARALRLREFAGRLPWFAFLQMRLFRLVMTRRVYRPRPRRQRNGLEDPGGRGHCHFRGPPVPFPATWAISGLATEEPFGHDLAARGWPWHVEG